MIDLLAILPTCLAYFLPEIHSLVDIRILRLMRVFRVLKLTHYLAEYAMLGEALRASQRKIMAFLNTISMVLMVVGMAMHVIEGPTTASPAFLCRCTGPSPP